MKSSVREKAIFYVGGRRRVVTARGGNVLVTLPPVVAPPSGLWVPGMPGFDGAPGEPGPPGPPGATGATGATGPAGSGGSGSMPPFFEGLTGPEGPMGPPGPRGPMGAAGADGSGGNWPMLEEHTASSSATLDFTNFISSTYEAYFFSFHKIIPANDAVQFWMRVGTGAGPTYDTGNNYATSLWRYFSGGSGASGSQGAAQWTICLAIDTTASANNSLGGHLFLYDPQSSIYKIIEGQVHTKDDGGNAYLGHQLGGHYLSTTALTAVRFLMQTGNIASGTIRVYGIPKA